MNEPENYLFSHMNKIENGIAVIYKETKKNKKVCSDIIATGFVVLLANYFIYKAIDCRLQKLEKNNDKTKEE